MVFSWICNDAGLDTMDNARMGQGAGVKLRWPTRDGFACFFVCFGEYPAALSYLLPFHLDCSRWNKGSPPYSEWASVPG